MTETPTETLSPDEQRFLAHARADLERAQDRLNYYGVFVCQSHNIGQTDFIDTEGVIHRAESPEPASNLVQFPDCGERSEGD